MTLSREEIAARVLCALVTKDGVNGYGSASDAVRAADDLLLALKPAEVAPVPPPAPTPAAEAKRPAPCPPPVAGRVDGGEALIDREWLAADILRNITAAGHKVFDRPADEVAKQIHALIEATLGPVPEAGK